jgi:hypothetical protein
MLNPASAIDHRRGLLCRQAFCRDLAMLSSSSTFFDSDADIPSSSSFCASQAFSSSSIIHPGRSAFSLSLDMTHHGCFLYPGNYHRAESALAPAPPQQQQQQDSALFRHHQGHFFVGSQGGGGEEAKKRSMACSEHGWNKRRRLHG